MSEEIKNISDKFITLMPSKIYLFGSYARGDQQDDSDYDFYLVFPDNAGDQIELSQSAYWLLRGMKRKPVDIVVGYESSFQRRSQLDTLERRVKNEGVLLYAR